MTVALSFIFVLARDVRASAPDLSGPAAPPRRATRFVLRAIGLVGLAVDRRPGARRGLVVRRRRDAVPVGLRLGRDGHGLRSDRSGLALRRPVLHAPRPRRRRASAPRRRRPGRPAAYPVRLGRWPGAIGFVGFVWLELAMAGGGPSVLFIVLVGYTAFTLAMMAQFGRDTWRSNGETFTRLVPAPRPTRGLRPRGRDRAASGAGRSPAACWSPDGRPPTWPSSA